MRVTKNKIYIKNTCQVFLEKYFHWKGASSYKKSTVITTNKAFSEWGEIFTNASCVVSIIDRLVHHSEIIDIKANSYRLEEAKEEAIQKKEARSKHKTVIGETK